MLGFGAIITIMIIASTYILFELNAVSNAAKITLTSHVRVVDLAKQLQGILNDENAYAQKYLITRDETYFSLFVETGQEVDRCLDLLLNAQMDETERSLVGNIRQAHVSFVDSVQRNKNGQEPEYPLAHGNQRSDTMETLNASLDQLISTNQASIRSAVSGMETTTNRSAKVALSLIGCTLLAAITAAFFIARTITRPIGGLIRGTEQIARSKYEPVSVSSNDEIALLTDAFNDMSKKIKEINELRTQMMQQISHEVQTPLQSMLSAHDILKNQYPGPLNDEQHQLVDTIFRGINKLENFSKQYLDLARIESGMMKYHMEPADLVRIVEPLVDDARLIAAQKNIALEMSALPAPEVMVDVEKISIVVSNLLSNAIKYTRADGKISIKIGPCNMGARVEVQDSGIGIIEDEIPKVFARFYQANHADRIKSKGTGVGLALVKAYTEGHGGKVYVTSTVDQGSTFIVELPAPTKFLPEGC
jgi:two-component system, NtrC family, sensor histidine kinase GlrK